MFTIVSIVATTVVKIKRLLPACEKSDRKGAAVGPAGAVSRSLSKNAEFGTGNGEGEMADQDCPLMGMVQLWLFLGNSA
jgi:hypothetical protein